MNIPLPTRRLGASGLDVTSIGLGLMSLSGLYGVSSDDNGIAVIHHALERGINFLDSADLYGGGHNETLLGRALREAKGTRRDQVIVATKFGQFKLASGGNGVDGRPEYVQAACEASLKRLGLEAIDLYYVHRVDPKVPIEDTVGAMARLVEQGKVRALGLCEASPATIRRAHKVHPLSALQTEYSLLYREDAEEMLKTTRELGITFVAYSPLGRSLLTGAVHDAAEVANDRRNDHPRFHAGNFERNRELVAGIEAMASETDVRFAVENMYPWKVTSREFAAYQPGWDVRDEDYRHTTLDLSHTSVSRSDALEMARDLGDRLVHVHLADGSGSTLDEHLVPGRGNQPCSDLLQVLGETGFDGHVVVEISTRKALDRAERERDLRHALAFARGHLAGEDVGADPALDPVTEEV